VVEKVHFGNIAKQIIYWKPKPGQIPENFALFCLESILRGLNFAHEQSHLHKNLLPSNIWLCKSDQMILKIGQFGVKKTLGNNNFYRSPEECANLPLDSKSEIFQVGCIIHEMLTGKIVWMKGIDPQSDDNQPEIVDGRIQHSVQDKLPLTVSRNLRYLIYLMLQKDPARRPSIK